MQSFRIKSKATKKEFVVIDKDRTKEGTPFYIMVEYEGSGMRTESVHGVVNNYDWNGWLG